MIGALLLACAPPPERSADACASCHQDQHAAWGDSAHGQGRSDVFDAWLPEVRRAWGPEAADRCVSCHEPGFVEGEGVGCVACHAAVGNRGEADGALEVDLRAPIAGRPGGDAPHEVVRRPLLSSSSLCATCHEVTGPSLLVERTGSEHAAWGGSETCAGCHLRGHTFAVEPLFAEGVTLEVSTADGAVRVEVRNAGAGHAVPTGAAFLRDLWVDLSFAPRVLEIGPRPARGGVPVPLLTDADGTIGEALAPGETASVVVPLPPDVDPDTVEATLWYGRYRPELLEALRVTGPPPTAVLRARAR